MTILESAIAPEAIYKKSWTGPMLFPGCRLLTLSIVACEHINMSVSQCYHSDNNLSEFLWMSYFLQYIQTSMYNMYNVEVIALDKASF